MGVTRRLGSWTDGGASACCHSGGAGGALHPYFSLPGSAARPAPRLAWLVAPVQTQRVCCCSHGALASV